MRDFRVVAANLSATSSNLLFTLAFALTLDTRDFGLVAGFWLFWQLAISAFRWILGERLFTEDGKGAANGYLALSLVVWVGAVCVSGIPSMLLGVEVFWAVLWYSTLFAVDAKRLFHMATGQVLQLHQILLIDVTRLAISLASVVLATFMQQRASAMLVGLAMISSLLWLSIPRKGQLRDIRALLGGVGRFEAHTSLQFAFGTFGIQTIQFVALAVYGPEEFGLLRLASILASPSATFFSSFQTTLIRHYDSLKNSSKMLEAMLRHALLFSFGATLLLSVTWLVVWPLFSSLPQLSAPEFPMLLLFSSISAILGVAGQPGGAAIKVKKMGKEALIGSLLGLTLVLIVLPFTPLFGIIHFALVLVLGTALTVASSYYLAIKYGK